MSGSRHNYGGSISLNILNLYCCFLSNERHKNISNGITPEIGPDISVKFPCELGANNDQI